jgi:tRNA threonylcarbamoyladenosine biosynthesis protein TsaB
MKLLLINTCGLEGIVALAEDAAVVGLEVLPGRSSSESLMPAVARLMAKAGWTVRDLAAIAVVIGPGSFTGVRVGLSTAKGLCEAGGVGMIAMSRLALVAASTHVSEARHGAPTAVALLDAGRGEYYCGVYNDRGQDGTCVSEELLKLEAVRGLTAQGSAFTCEERVASALQIELVPEPGAAEMLAMALRRIAADDWSDVAVADANYLRRTDAELLMKGGRA